MSDSHDPRRRQLVQALTVGGFVLGSGLHREVFAGADQSIHFLEGSVTVNGQAANKSTLIRGNDLIETGDNGRIAFTVGKDAFLLRENSNLKLQGNDLLLDTLRLFSGKLLSVFGRRTATERLALRTPIATMGIRGTGVYTEVSDDKSYMCTCYGNTVVVNNKDLRNRKIIKSTYHDALWVNNSADTNAGLITQAPKINHEDDELVLLESLVGRTPSAEVLEAAQNPRANRSY